MALSSKICVLTGAASGLGKATALRLARAGARVAIVDLPSQPGAALAATIGERAFFAPADVTSVAQVRRRRRGTGGVGRSGVGRNGGANDEAPVVVTAVRGALPRRRLVARAALTRRVELPSFSAATV